MRMDHVKALFFDVFGTLVDWRSGVAGAAQVLLESKGIVLDWSDFADAWPAIPVDVSAASLLELAAQLGASA